MRAKEYTDFPSKWLCRRGKNALGHQQTSLNFSICAMEDYQDIVWYWMYFDNEAETRKQQDELENQVYPVLNIGGCGG